MAVYRVAGDRGHRGGSIGVSLRTVMIDSAIGTSAIPSPRLRAMSGLYHSAGLVLMWAAGVDHEAEEG